uniref:Vezatin, adherens junctions transmembrane protein n=1 Tax=Prolemur simus TaxID=1328070 RepID=A0A8C8YPA2_PROSS
MINAAVFVKYEIASNSPLYQYLQDLGHTDFEICSSLSPKTEKCMAEGQQKPPSRVLPKQGILLKVAEIIKSWIFSSQCSKKDDLLHKLVQPSHSSVILGPW